MAHKHPYQRLYAPVSILLTGTLLSISLLPGGVLAASRHGKVFGRHAIAAPRAAGHRVASSATKALSIISLDNLNNGFEIASGDSTLPAQWQLFRHTQAQFVRDTTVARSGIASARISDSGGDSSGVPAFYISPQVTVLPGQTYTAGVWARGQDATGGIRVALAWFDSSHTYLGQIESPWLAKGTTAWTQLTASGVAPAQAVSVQVHLKSSHNTGMAWFDDVTFDAPASASPTATTGPSTTATPGPSATASDGTPSATATGGPPGATATGGPPATATRKPGPPATNTVIPPPATATKTVVSPPATATTIVPPAATATNTVAPPPATATTIVAPTATSAPPPPGGFVTRSGAQLLLGGQTFRFAGANLSWLGLSQDGGSGVHYPSHFQISDGLETLRAMGGTVVRAHTLGISVGCSLCLEPSLGVFNSSAWDSIDYSIYRAGQLGLHLIIPLTDQYRYYHGGRCTFTDWAGLTSNPGGTTCADNANSDAFFTDMTVRGYFETYISTLLNHVNSYTGLALKNDPTILAWELGNELNTNPGSNWGIFVPWEQAIATYIKGIDPSHLVSASYAYHGKDSGELAASALDMYPLHQDGGGLSVSDLQATAAAVTSAQKVFYVGEYDWNNHNGGTPLTQWLPAIEATGSGVSGDLYWQLLPHDDSHGFVQHGDGFTLHYAGDSSDMQSRAVALRNHAYAMSGVSVPAYNVPGAPLITNISKSGSHNVLEWQGAAGAATYSVAMSTAGASGPWTSVCQQCATDNNTPWSDPSSLPSGHVWYQVTPYNMSGVAGAASAAYQAE